MVRAYLRILAIQGFWMIRVLGQRVLFTTKSSNVSVASTEAVVLEPTSSFNSREGCFFCTVRETNTLSVGFRVDILSASSVIRNTRFHRLAHDNISVTSPPYGSRHS